MTNPLQKPSEESILKETYHAIRQSYPDRNIAYCGSVRPPGRGFPEREVPVENRCKECAAVMMSMVA